ncbi:YqhR family membrane protein [Bacillus suaedaesalsae]|uniref:YqhR n=1 Tax=Bacillus suaedaesalsae TaxID=2810349 RepID=A0ABS2DIH9_9BACI|nr:hypothetical protein [Bacillus suaedaesalsae]
MADKKKLEQNNKEEPMSTTAKIAITGLFGGIFWSFLGYLCYLFSFTKVPPNIIFDPIAVGDWKEGVLSQYIAIVILGLISILAAFAYYAMLRKFDKIWIGILFGGVLWGIVFVVLNPVFENIEPLRKMDLNTFVTSLCLFILYGTFIGYSISFEESEHQMLKQKEQKQPSYSNE